MIVLRRSRPSRCSSSSASTTSKLLWHLSPPTSLTKTTWVGICLPYTTQCGQHFNLSPATGHKLRYRPNRHIPRIPRPSARIPNRNLSHLCHPINQLLRRGCWAPGHLFRICRVQIDPTRLRFVVPKFDYGPWRDFPYSAMYRCNAYHLLARLQASRLAREATMEFMRKKVRRICWKLVGPRSGAIMIHHSNEENYRSQSTQIN